MTDKELERLHLLATLRTYGPASAAFIRERANDEAAHEAFDPVPMIEPRGIAGRLVGLLNDGLAKRVHGAPGEVSWDISAAGARALEDGLNELDGWVYTEEAVNGPLFVGAITDEMVERAARAVFDAIEREDTLVISGGLPARSWDDLPDGCQEHEHHRSYVRIALAAAFTTNGERDGD